MKINLQVETGMLANPDFQDVLLQACKDLSQPGIVRKLCIHETAHLFYFEMVCTLMGPETPKPEFVEPMIIYDEFEEKPEDRFKAILASVKTPFKDYGIAYTDEILDFLARGAVGGGIFLIELEKVAEDESGDKDDRDLFAGHFMLAQDQGWVPSQKIEQMLAKAKDNVRLDLKNQLLKQGFLKDAARLETDYFSLKRDV